MALELKDLNQNERLALAALLERAVAADRYVTDPEARQLHAIIAAVGRKAYEEAAEEADRRFPEEGDLWRFLDTVERQEARELIYETVLEAVLVDAPRSEENEVLAQLSRSWHVKARIVDSPT
jgi:hypothetical protein